MAHSYMRFDFGTDEEKAQLACHKLDVWKQAFRLDKKLLYKLDRGPADGASSEEDLPEPNEEKANAKAKGKSGKVSQEKAAKKSESTVHLLVRLYFSSHEKLSEQRWLDRIPSEELFKDASPEVISKSSPEFTSIDQNFERLE
jgi:hypothetical protein